MPLKGFDYDELFNEEVPGGKEETDDPQLSSFGSIAEYDNRSKADNLPDQPQSQPEQQVEAPEPPPEDWRQKFEEEDLGKVKGYDSIDEYDEETGTYGLATWEEVEAARAKQAEEEFLRENPRPVTWFEKTANMIGATTDQVAAAQMVMSEGLGEMPASLALEAMHNIGLITDEDYEEATATKEGADAYRDRFKEVAENAPWWNPLQRFVGFMAMSTEQKENLQSAAKRYWLEAEKHPVSQEVLDLEATPELDELRSPTWYLERLGPEAIRMGIAAMVTAGTKSPAAGAAVIAGDIYGRKLEDSRKWVAEHRPDLNYGEQQSLAQGIAMQSAFVEYMTEKFAIGKLIPGLGGGSGLVSKTGFAGRVSDFLSKTRLGRRAMLATTKGSHVLDNLFPATARTASALKRAAPGVLAEGVQEATAGNIERFTEYMLGDPEALEGNLKETIVEAVGGAAIGGAIGVPGRLIEQAPKHRQRRVEAMVKNARRLSSTPAGMQALQELSQNETPSRRDFIDAGFHKDAIGNAAERAELVGYYTQEALQKQADVRDAILQNVKRQQDQGEQVQQPQILSQPVSDAPALQQLKEKAGQIYNQPKQMAGPKMVRQMQKERRELSKNIEKTYKLRPMMADAVAEVVQSTLTPEEVSIISFERGGKPSDSALYQIAEVVQRIQGDPKTKPTGNEDLFFGKILPKFWKQTKKELNETSGVALTREAKAQIKAGKPIKEYGADFDKHYNKRGTKKILERAVQDYAKFVENNPQFEQYYESEVGNEREQLVRQYPELADDNNFLFYRMINGIASAQTGLGKNTEETIAAYGGFRQTGQIPVKIETRKGKILKSGKRQIKDAPVYALPANKRPITGTEATTPETAHEFDVTMPSDVDNIVKVMKELESVIPQEVVDVLTEKTDIPEDAKIIDAANLKGKKKGDPVGTLKEYLYNHAAPLYITSDIAKRANTTSKPLVLKMYLEWKGYDPDTRESDFRNRVRTAFEIGGGSSQYNKARNYQVLNTLLQQEQFQNADGSPNIPELIRWLNERVPWKQLSDERKSLGFGALGNKGDIVDTVYTAEGQGEMIPRTFIFGPKVGAYMLNRMADYDPKNADYNTMDVWESRFWRGFNNDIKTNKYGIAEGLERKVYMRQARDFVKEYEKQTGKKLKVSAGQAGRWYLMKTAMADAGYLKAGRDETIAGFTGELVDRFARQQLMQQGDRLPPGSEEFAIGDDTDLTELEPVEITETEGERQKQLEEREAALIEEFGEYKEFITEPSELERVERIKALGGPEGQGGLVTVLFQKAGEQILGSMEKLPGGEILLRGFQNSDADTAVEELAHGIRALVFNWDISEGQRGISDEHLWEIETWAHGDTPHQPGDPWTRDAEEKFAAGLRKYLQEGVAPVSRLQRAFNTIGRVLTKIYKQVIRRNDIQVPDNIKTIFDQLVTRRENLIEKQYETQLPRWDSVERLPGAKSFADPLPAAHAAKAAYLQDKGMPMRRQAELVKWDRAFAERIAAAYDRMPHAPNDPAVKAAYAAMAQETLDQWEYVKATGLKVEPMPPGVDPYEGDLGAVHRDLKENNHLWFFPTNQGYGAEVGAVDPDNPMLAKTGEKIGDHELVVNDIFRIVHDYFGHGLEGTTFGPRGEENAWQAHVRMYSPLAARAMTSETRGQNSWVNTRPENDPKQGGAQGTVYAPQKMGLMPKWTSQENVAPDKGTQPDVVQVQEEADVRPEDVTQPAAEPAQTDGPAPQRRGIRGRGAVRPAGETEGPAAEVDAIERAPLPSEGSEADTGGTAISQATQPIGRGESAWIRDEKGNLKAKPISKRQAVRNILDRIGLTAVDNFKGIAPTAVGYYKKARLGLGSGGVGLAIRRRELADIGVAVHEAVHYYDDLLGITDLNRPITESAIKNLSPSELAALANESYQDVGQRTVKEGFAEAVRLMVMVENPKSAFRSSVAYDVATKLIEAPGNEQLKKFIEDTRKDVGQYMAQPDADKLQRALTNQRGSIVDPSESYFARNSRQWHTIKGAVRFLENRLLHDKVDAEKAVREVERRFKQFWNANPVGEMSANEAWATVVRHAGGRFDQKMLQHSNFVRQRTSDLVLGTDKNPGILDTFKDFTQKEVDDFGRYMYAIVANQRMQKDPQYQPGEVDADVIERYIAEHKSPKFDKAAKEVTNYFNGLLKDMEAAGLITDIDVKNMTESQELYMPFYRQFADSSYSGYGGQFVNVKPPLKGLKKGSVMPVLDVYDAIQKRTHEVVGAINRKTIEDSMIDLLTTSGVADEFLRITSGPGPGVISRVKGGVKEYYQVDPDLLDAMGQLGNPVANKVFLQMLNKLARIPRNLMVNWNPGFAARNFPRDWKTAQIKGLQDMTGIEGKSDYVVAMLKDPLVEVARIMAIELGKAERTDVDKMYDMLGGRLDRKMESVMADRDLLGRKRRRNIGQQESSLLDHGKKLAKHTVLLNEATELAPRKIAFLQSLMALGDSSKGEFSVTKDGEIKGEVPEWAMTQAMSNAQEITVNFNRRGAWAPFIEPFTLYFNASMQGSFYSRGQVLRNPESRKKLVIATALSATAHLMGLAAMSMVPSPEDEDKSLLDHYWEIPEYYRQSQSVFIAPGGIAIGIPREREWGPIQRLIEETARAALGPEEFAPTELVWDELKNTISESVSATGGTVPTMAQLLFNYNIHYGEEIESYWDQQKYITQRFDSRTMEGAKFLSDNLLHYEVFFGGFSPKEIDFLMRSMGFGTIAGFADMASRPGDKLPFMVDEKPRQSQIDFYVKIRELKQKVQGIGAGVEFKNEEKIKEDYAAFNLAQSIMRKIRESDLSEEEKSKYITGLARWALGRDEDSLYPNPLFNQTGLPAKVKSSINKVLSRKRKEAKGDAKKRFRKPAPER